MSENNQNQGLIHTLLADMPPTAKALVSFLLIFPIVLAVSGMLLNVNVGKVLEEIVAISLEKQRGAMNSALDERFATLQRSLENVSAQQAQQFLEIQAILDQHATALGQHDQRLTVLERQVLIDARRPPLPPLQDRAP